MITTHFNHKCQCPACSHSFVTSVRQPLARRPYTNRKQKPLPTITLPDEPASIKTLAEINKLRETKMYFLVMKFVRTGQIVRKRVSRGPLLGTPYLYAKAA